MNDEVKRRVLAEIARQCLERGRTVRRSWRLRAIGEWTTGILLCVVMGYHAWWACIGYVVIWGLMGWNSWRLGERALGDFIKVRHQVLTEK